MSTQVQDVPGEAEKRMAKSLDALQLEFAKVRTGRAHPSLLDHVKVNYYGSDVPISQVARVNILDPRTLSVAPFEKSMVGPVEKAILNSDLGLNPATAGELIRIPMPPLTEERRKDLIKVVRGEAENARVAIRNIRRDANNALKEAVKKKELPEDEERRLQERVQKLTDQTVAQVDQLLAAKEKELMEV